MSALWTAPVVAVSGTVGAGALGVLVALLAALRSVVERGRRHQEHGRRQRSAPPHHVTGTGLAGRRPCQLELTEADLSDADLRHMRLGGRSIAGRDLSRSLLRGANANGVHAAGAVFDGADLARASLRHGDLAGASFRGANVAETDFSHCSLIGADFRDATGLDQAVWHHSRCDRTTRWPAGFLPAVMGIQVVRPPVAPADFETSAEDPAGGDPHTGPAPQDPAALGLEALPSLDEITGRSPSKG